MLTWLDNDFLHAENWVLGLDYDVWEFITFGHLSMFSLFW